jgi:hypothetical protein
VVGERRGEEQQELEVTAFWTAQERPNCLPDRALRDNHSEEGNTSGGMATSQDLLDKMALLLTNLHTSIELRQLFVDCLFHPFIHVQNILI